MCSASSAMSSRRSRSGGSVTRMTSSRYKQIEPEASGFDFRVQPTVRRRDDADVDPSGGVLADAPQFALLNHPEHFRLCPQRELADFIQEQGTAVRLFEHPGTL
jgi:hypothetical protein